MFYKLTLPKFRDSSTERPFSTIINEKLLTKKKVLIIKNPNKPTSKNYIYHLEDGNSYGMDSELEVVDEIPIETEVIFDKAELHKGRVSGTTTAYLYGKIYSTENQKEYAFQYPWGNYHALYEDQPYWTFDLAFWQDETLTEKYYIEVP
ncbi:hypothetical protein [Winogradskyella vidalii]|uniref:hypothetical protein n=1 Tax=Winogradskyella vidalii TaxID=2615024 RepID=UPI0015C98A2E|nr:hypothetical protein [Winogradskyella vidalii]